MVNRHTWRRSTGTHGGGQQAHMAAVNSHTWRRSTATHGGGQQPHRGTVVSSDMWHTCNGKFGGQSTSWWSMRTLTMRCVGRNFHGMPSAASAVKYTVISLSALDMHNPSTSKAVDQPPHEKSTIIYKFKLELTAQLVAPTTMHLQRQLPLQRLER